jgi:hypothetical protein
VRLLETLAASMSVALENARLFDETQRLLKETEARNAELAVINSIQQAVGAALDFQGIVDAVGDKLREVFQTGDMSIRWWDEATQLETPLYYYEHGRRLAAAGPAAPVARRDRGAGLRERKVWLGHSRAEQAAPASGREGHRPGAQHRRGADGRRRAVLGVVALEDHQRDHAFGPAACACSRP